MTNPPAAASAPDPGLGYTEVDSQPGIDTVLAGMDATAQSPAVRRLRAWERERLAVQPGDDVLDVGCGLGDVIIEVASLAGAGGRAVGVDASVAMLDVARDRAKAAGVAVEFHTADATNLPEADASMEVCRSERMLQWLAEPSLAVAEMVRVLRPGGRLALLDTDWRTFTADLPDLAMVAEFSSVLWDLRGAPASVGSHLLNLCRDAGLVDLDVTAAPHVWTQWDPDVESAPAGLFPMRPTIEQMIDTGTIDAALGERFLAQIEQAARADRFFMSVGMFAVFGRKPLP